MSTSHAESRLTWRPKDTLANRVMLMRTELGLSQREAAMKSGVSYGTIQGVEAGRTPRKEIATLTKLAKAFGVDKEWLFNGGPLEVEMDPDEGPTMGGAGPSLSEVTGPDTSRYTGRLGSVIPLSNRVTKRAEPLLLFPPATNPQRSELALVG